MDEEPQDPPVLTHLVAGTQPDGSKTWTAVADLQAAVIQGATWRAMGLGNITFAQIVSYTATIHIVADGKEFDLPVPDVPGS